MKHLERRDEKTDTQEPRCLPGHVAKDSRSSAKERASPASAATNTEKLKPPGLANSHGETQPRKGVGASELNLPSYIQIPKSQGPARSLPDTEDRRRAPFIGCADSTTDLGPDLDQASAPTASHLNPLAFPRGKCL